MSDVAVIEVGFSCFHYKGEGRRCGLPCGPQTLWCEEHLMWKSKATNVDLFASAAACLTSCLQFDESGKFSIAVKDSDQWGNFCNLYNLLKRRGYLPGQILDGLSTVLSSHEVFSSTMKTLGLDSKKWKVFERLVARLYVINMENDVGDTATIIWNDKIPEINSSRPRQVDVSIRFKRGFHTYLTVVECRNTNSPIEVSDVEAFVEKIRKIGADKGVMVSLKGFQAGAVEAARQGKIDLFVLMEEVKKWEPFTQTITSVNYNLANVLLTHSDSQVVSLHGYENLPYLRGLKYAEEGTKYGTLGDLIDSAVNAARTKRRMDSHEWVYRPQGAATVNVGDGTISTVKEIKVFLKANVERSSTRLELPPRIINCVLQSARNNDKFIVPQWKLGTADAGSALDPSKFYSNLLFQRYRCNRVSPNIELALLDDVQHGMKLQATLTLRSDVADRLNREGYFEIVDSVMCKKLEEDYLRYADRKKADV